MNWDGVFHSEAVYICTSSEHLDTNIPAVLLNGKQINKSVSYWVAVSLPRGRQSLAAYLGHFCCQVQHNNWGSGGSLRQHNWRIFLSLRLLYTDLCGAKWWGWVWGLSVWSWWDEMGWVERWGGTDWMCWAGGRTVPASNIWLHQHYIRPDHQHCFLYALGAFWDWASLAANYINILGYIKCGKMRNGFLLQTDWLTDNTITYIAFATTNYKNSFSFRRFRYHKENLWKSLSRFIIFKHMWTHFWQYDRNFYNNTYSYSS